MEMNKPSKCMQHISIRACYYLTSPEYENKVNRRVTTIFNSPPIWLGMWIT